MNQPDWQRQFPKIEVETPPSPDSDPSVRPHSPSWQGLQRQIKQWFEGLPTAGRAIAVLAAVALGFSLLKTVLQLVSAVFGIAFFGLILYGAYKFLIAPNSSSS
ncbi:MAG: hypothetical protein SW833_18060 [Cyanobacteriota bacterium]|nr:hypothetical protein [Cyanobacteriota bacterium]